jgi:hypothetical protein
MTADRKATILILEFTLSLSYPPLNLPLPTPTPIPHALRLSYPKPASIHPYPLSPLPTSDASSTRFRSLTQGLSIDVIFPLQLSHNRVPLRIPFFFVLRVSATVMQTMLRKNLTNQ